MKALKLFSCAVIVMSILSCKVLAQNSPAAGDYVTNNTMGDFEGTWRWVSGTDTFQVYLAAKKVYYNMNGGFYWDNIVGWHLYKKHKAIIENTYPSINNVAVALFKGSNENMPAAQLGGILRDSTNHKSGELTLQLNKAVTPNQLVWKLRNLEGLKFRTPSDPPYDSGFTLPKDMVLIKQ